MGGYPPGHVGTKRHEGVCIKRPGPLLRSFSKMPTLRSGRETGRRTRVRAQWRRVAREARRQARRERWERKQRLTTCWHTFARGVRLQARREHMTEVSTADQQRKCVVCYSKKAPVHTEVQLRMMERLKELNVSENTIMYPYQAVCCGKALHLACYISFNGAQFLKRKDLWRCPNCRTMAYANVSQGNFHVGTQNLEEKPNDIFIQRISTALPKDIQVVRVGYESAPFRASYESAPRTEMPFMEGTLIHH